MELIRNVKDSSKLCLATGARKNQIDVALQAFGLTKVFSPIVTAEDYAPHSKPDPRVYLLTVEQLTPSERENIIVIEDSPDGIKAARVAGLFCIAVTHTHTSDELKEANLIIDDLRDIKVITLIEGNISRGQEKKE